MAPHLTFNLPITVYKLQYYIPLLTISFSQPALWKRRADHLQKTGMNISEYSTIKDPIKRKLLLPSGKSHLPTDVVLRRFARAMDELRVFNECCKNMSIQKVFHKTLQKTFFSFLRTCICDYINI